LLEHGRGELIAIVLPNLYLKEVLNSVSLTVRETWTVIHGMVIGALFLVSFTGGLFGLLSLRPELVTGEGARKIVTRLANWMWLMAATAWLTVITGTYIVYPWYRAPDPSSPRSVLLANPATAEWHEFGMEWKEHVAWFAPLLATAAAYVVWYYGKQLVNEEKARKAAMVVFSLAFFAAAVAGIFGAFLNKAAPTR